MPTKPLYSIGLSDADASSSLSFMKQKLRDAGVDLDFTQEQTDYVARLGGRASDLESVRTITRLSCILTHDTTPQLIHKVQNGQNVKDAVEDIIYQGVGELRKNAFGDDVDDAKSLPWAREQVWHVVHLLSKQPEVSCCCLSPR